MRMSSLKERIELLECDLKEIPPRISVYHDLPFAILRYDPTDEWELRREVKLLAVHGPHGSGRHGKLPGQDLRLKVGTMASIGELLSRYLCQRIEEVIQVHQSDEQ